MKKHKGFTLAEVAVVVVIVALLLAGLMIPLGTQIELKNTAETQRSMDQIKEAMIGFALANGRLPCPADGSIAAGAANAGAEQCANAFGVVPWAALGVAETDAWGRRFSYWVSPIFTDAVGTTFNTAGQSPTCTPTPTPVQSSFALCSLGNMTVNTRNDGTHATVAIGPTVPVVIVSHGKNGYGAYNVSGILLPAPAAGTDEAANASHSSAATTFYSRTPTPAASGCNDAAAGASFCEFDDIVTMIPAQILVARMVSAGRLP
jgi:prepilin-type N-terminal cleavage/methylation domain-containing protein